MTVAHAIQLTELLSIMLIVFGFALRSSVRDVTSLFRNPSLLLRSFLAMNVLLPLFAASMGAVFALRPAIVIALVALALSPVPPFLPGQLKLIAQPEYVGLFGATSLLAIVLAPLTVVLIGVVFSRQMSIAPVPIAKVVALTALLPLSLGIFARRMMPEFAERLSHLAGKVGMWLLTLAFVPVLIDQWPAMLSLIGNGTVIAFVAFTVVGLAVGHLLGGPIPDHRAVLALATASRHPGVALTIATEIFPDQTLVAPAMLLYLVVCAITSTPYILWCRRVHKKLAAAA